MSTWVGNPAQLREDALGHFSPFLLRFFYQLHIEGIKAVEWGTGLNESMGVPVLVLVRGHFFIFGTDRLLESLLSRPHRAAVCCTQHRS